MWKGLEGRRNREWPASLRFDTWRSIVAVGFGRDSEGNSSRLPLVNLCIPAAARALLVQAVLLPLHLSNVPALDLASYSRDIEFISLGSHEGIPTLAKNQLGSNRQGEQRPPGYVGEEIEEECVVEWGGSY
jgi:hypothetical protein